MRRAETNAKNLKLVCTLVPVMLAHLGVVASAESIYWTEVFSGKIRRADFDGQNVYDLVTGVPNLGRIAVDVSGGKMYWTQPFNHRIWRSNLDGTSTELIYDGVGDGALRPVGLAIDRAAGKLYWTLGWALPDGQGNGQGKIQCGNLDGSGGSQDVWTGLWGPNALALDLCEQRVYWVDDRADKIQRANLDGTGGVEDLVTFPTLQNPGGIALDLENCRLYWTDYTQSPAIWRAELDGSAIEPLAFSSNPLGLRLDVSDGKMYWADYCFDKILWANMEIPEGETYADRTDIEEIVVLPNVNPAGLELDLHRRKPGDLDGDGDIDIGDFALFQIRFTGPQP
jgi:sugar lactone lactonase YvrE